jgi:hypothetical protein
MTGGPKRIGAQESPDGVRAPGKSINTPSDDEFEVRLNTPEISFADREYQLTVNISL